MISRNNKGGFKTAAAAASAAAACTFFIASPSQAASKSLFEATEVRGRQPRTSSAAHVTRTRFARLRADALPTAAAAERGDRVRIDLFEGTSVTAELGKLRRRNAENYTWHGALAGESGGWPRMATPTTSRVHRSPMMTVTARRPGRSTPPARTPATTPRCLSLPISHSHPLAGAWWCGKANPARHIRCPIRPTVSRRSRFTPAASPQPRH